ncbi:ATP-binding protein [Nitrincola sp.]|uniref:HAMP domain-containing sensor histidine kinase n=1 Tax=Nitrincola sp. TaxID=1926584 RepID=UPI003A936061
MRWHQHLYWKIFLATWLISAVLMGGLVYGLLRVSETRHWQDLLEAKAAGHAQLIVERHEIGIHESSRGGGDRGGRGRIPLRVTNLADGEVISDFRYPIPATETASLVIESDTGKRYRVDMPLPEQPVHLERMLRFLLSVQMVLILVMSALVALLVSYLVVRPVNRLRDFARSLYDEQNLSSRTEGYLSRRTDEIGELAREFDSMAGYVEKTLNARQNLLRDVSHELRAPLARLQVAAGILEQQSGEQINALHGQISRECDQLAHLIDELMSLSRLDDMTLELQSPAPLKPLLEQIRQDYSLLYPDHQISLRIEPDSLTFSQSSVLLNRILGNALQNALKYTPAGGQVLLTAYRQGRQLCLAISDDGPGVDASLLKDIFEPFVRGGSTQQGYGLGLSILRGAVRRLGGEVRAENLSEGGFRLTVCLPAEPA